MQDTATDQPPENPPSVNEEQLRSLLMEMRSRQSLPMAVLAGFGASLAGAVIWAVITVATGYQIGWMAVGVGFLVGYAVRILGKGIDQPFGILGAVFALFGCLLGNLLTFVGVISATESLPYFSVLTQLDLGVVLELYKATFSPIDLLFYGIAIYEGYKLSFQRISQEQLAQVMN